MNNTLAILGAGGHGKVVADAALLNSEWSDVVFFDDNHPSIVNNSRWTVAGTSSDLFNDHHQFSGLVVAIGDNKLRLFKTLELKQAGANVVSVIHPKAVVSPYASIAIGSVVFADAIINIDARVGRACIVNTGSIVEHDCHLYDGVHLSPNAALAGETEVGECSWIGIGAITKQLTVIGSGVVVGAGAVVITSVPDDVTVVGNPAVITK